MTDIVVIGGGMSGMTAALYALRGGKSALIMESENIGGQIASSPRVENFPSVKVISGAKLAEVTFDQVTAAGAEFEPEKAVSILKHDGIFTVTGEYGLKADGKAVIIANGVKHKTLNARGESELLGKGVYYCAVCDGAFYKGKEAAVIGDANSALQYALYLSALCLKVTVIALFDKLFADKYLVELINKSGNISVIYNKSTLEFKGKDSLDGILIKDTVSGKEELFKTDAVFIAIGQIPDNGRFSNYCDIDEKGYIIADESCVTKTLGLFVAGDTRTKSVRQLTTACADGAVAAVNACRYIDEHK